MSKRHPSTVSAKSENISVEEAARLRELLNAQRAATEEVQLYTSDLRQKYGIGEGDGIAEFSGRILRAAQAPDRG